MCFQDAGDGSVPSPTEPCELLSPFPHTESSGPLNSTVTPQRTVSGGEVETSAVTSLDTQSMPRAAESTAYLLRLLSCYSTDPYAWQWCSSTTGAGSNTRQENLHILRILPSGQAKTVSHIRSITTACSEAHQTRTFTVLRSMVDRQEHVTFRSQSYFS